MWILGDKLDKVVPPSTAGELESHMDPMNSHARRCRPTQPVGFVPLVSHGGRRRSKKRFRAKWNDVT